MECLTERDNRGEEKEGYHSNDADPHQRRGSASHASEGNIVGCKVLLIRTARQTPRRSSKKTEADRQAVVGISRQVPAADANTIFLLLWFLVFVGVLYWFYSTLKRIEKTLVEIKKLLESKAS